MRAISIVTIPFVLVTACVTPTDPGNLGVLVETTVRSVALPPDVGGVTINFSVTNRGPATVYIARCGDQIVSGVDERVGAGWTHHSRAMCMAIYDMSRIPLAPGSTIESVTVMTRPGSFRLRVGVAATLDGEASWVAGSNSFVVE